MVFMVCISAAVCQQETVRFLNIAGIQEPGDQNFPPVIPSE